MTIHRETDQLGRERGEPLSLPSAHAVLHGEVLALHIAQLAQTLPQGLQASWEPPASAGERLSR